MQQLNCTQHTQLSCQVAAQFVGHVHEIDPVPDISSEHIILWGVNTSLLPRHDISFPYATRKYEIYCAWFFWNYQEPFISHHKSMVSSLELFPRWIHHWVFSPHHPEISGSVAVCSGYTLPVKAFESFVGSWFASASPCGGQFVIQSLWSTVNL
jgi:hypothetical protein